MEKVNSVESISPVNVAVLGPKCSYTDLACAKFLPSATRSQHSSITKVIEAVASSQVDYGLIPIENLLNGLVGETLDSLRVNSELVEIVNSTQLEVNHYIGVSQSSSNQYKDIRSIYSHPQALEQSREFLSEYCPQANLITCNSTSEATFRLNGTDLQIAAIASKEALELQNSKILGRTTSSYNATRFILVKRRDKPAVNIPTSYLSSEQITSILIHPGSDRKGLLLEVLSIISGKFNANLSAIHSRPDGLGGFVFYLELSLKDKQSELTNLISALKEYCSKETGGRAQISILGTYDRAPFFSPKISSIAIIGADGAMGKWFNQFFTSIGLHVIEIDTTSKIEKLEELKNASVVIFSVPMHKMEEASTQYKPFISKTSLIVENCSVKAKSIQCLLNNFSEGNEVLGIHTMFGPSIESIKRENVIITKTDTSASLSDEFEQIFYKAGALTHEGSIEEHDTCVAVLQALIQYSSIVLANTLLGKVDSLEKLKPYLTPNSRLALTNIERILLQSPDLLFDIQDQNANSKELIKEFSKSTLELERVIQSKPELSSLINKLALELGPKIAKLK